MTTRFSRPGLHQGGVHGDPCRAYFDWAATAPLRVCARKAMLSCLAAAGNPSSLHAEGRRARMMLEEAREVVAGALAVSSDEVFFTSGATEADNLGLLGAARAARRDRARRHVVVSALEHAAIRRPAEVLEREGFDVTVALSDTDGIVSEEALAAALRPDTALVALMAVSNELGTCQPIRLASAMARETGALLLCDAVQAPGHVPVDLASWGADLATFSGHKLGGPPGAGVLYCRGGVDLVPQQFGGEQERQRRAGTENVPAIVGLAAALEEATASLDASVAHQRAVGDRLQSLFGDIPECRVLGAGRERSPHISTLQLEGVDAETLLFSLDLAGVAASSGSACGSHTMEPSPVLLALGLSAAEARSTIRLSWGEATRWDEVEALEEVLPACVRRHREGRMARRAR